MGEESQEQLLGDKGKGCLKYFAVSLGRPRLLVLFFSLSRRSESDSVITQKLPMLRCCVLRRSEKEVNPRKITELKHSHLYVILSYCSTFVHSNSTTFLRKFRLQYSKSIVHLSKTLGTSLSGSAVGMHLFHQIDIRQSHSILIGIWRNFQYFVTFLFLN